MTPIATSAEMRARIYGKSLTCSPEGLSTKMMACVVKMVVYKTSKASGAVFGRQIAMTREPTAHDADGNTISVRKVGKNTVSVWTARQTPDTANKTTVKRVNDFFSLGRRSPCSPFGSSTKARDHSGLRKPLGRSFTRNPSKMHPVTTIGTAEMKGRVQLSKRAFTGSC
jgi:hypothetical protein